MRADEILDVFRACAEVINDAYASHTGRGYSGDRATQYHLDVAADAAALTMLHAAGFTVVSEESGTTGKGDVTVVIDPIDGSTNCDRGVPFFATSLAAIVNGELEVGLVRNLATGVEFTAIRGGGSRRDGEVIRSSGHERVNGAVGAFSGWPSRHIGWAQFRAMGAASLECCLVADGSLDFFVTANRSVLHPWDYLAGVLIAIEAGAVCAEYDQKPLVITRAEGRRPVFAATRSLADELLAAGAL